jgi:hypothetical protein
VVIQLFQLLFFLLGDGPSVLQVALSHCSAGKAELSLALATLSSLCLAMASRACYAGPTARHCAPLCAQLSRGPSLCVMPRALPRAVGALASVVHRTASWLPCWACDSVEWARLFVCTPACACRAPPRRYGATSSA